MDIPLPPRPWYVRHLGKLILGVALLALAVLVVLRMAHPTTLRLSADSVAICDVQQAAFAEYVTADGTLQPFRSVRVGALEAGTVSEVVREEGSMVHRGDTLFILVNPELNQQIADGRTAWQRLLRTQRQRDMEMQQKRITIRQQMLQTTYELSRLEKQMRLDREEFGMGIKSRAELDLAEAEYDYRHRRTELQLESLRSDSALAVLQAEMNADEQADEWQRLCRLEARRDELIVRAPCDGQLAGIGAILGQKIAAGTEMGEIKQMDRFRLTASLSEYYIDKVTVGQPATITSNGQVYALTISRIVPEVKDHSFPIELVFVGDMPGNARIGKSYQARIELSDAEPAIIIPKGNFYAYTGGQWIFRLKEGSSGTFIRVPVTIGRQNPLHYEVISGLQSGDRVLVAGYEGFGDAHKVVVR
jgi:multidrug efflux pump subunit AcrA (membrane-fusion protein)